MRILFCNYEYPPLGGGGGVINALLAEEMAKQHEVTVLTSQGLGLPRYDIENGVEIVRAPTVMRRDESVASMPSMMSFIPSGIWAGRKLLGKRQFDIINTHFVLPTGPVGHILSRFAKIPNVLSLHGGDLYDPSKALSPHQHWPFRVSIRYLLRNADMIAGQSSNTLQNMRTFYTPEIKGAQIPLAIREPQIDAPKRGIYGFSPDDILLITVGRLIPRKQVDQLIQMVANLRNEMAGNERSSSEISNREKSSGEKSSGETSSNKKAANEKGTVRLLVLGSGPQEETLRKLAQEHQITDNVHFMGFVDEQEKLGLLSMADIYVSTSQHEGFGLVYLEGMACGLPIICYNHGGQTDFLEDDETGFLVELDNLELFTERCRALIQNRVRRREISDYNREYAKEFFIDNCASRHEVLFNETIQAHRSGQRAWRLMERSAIGSD